MGAMTHAGGKLLSFLERIERLEEERKTLADDIADVYKELSGDGYDKDAAKIVLKIRKTKDGLDAWTGKSGTVDAYLAALGMLPPMIEARAGARVRENIEQFPPHNPETGELTDTQEQPVQPARDEPEGETDASGDFERDTRQSVPADLTDGNIVTDGSSRSANSPSPANAPRLAADDEAAQANPASSAPHSNPQPAASLGADTAGDVPPPSSPATLSVNQKCQKHKRGEFCGFAYSQASCWRCNQAAAQQSEAT